MKNRTFLSGVCVAALAGALSAAPAHASERDGTRLTVSLDEIFAADNASRGTSARRGERLRITDNFFPGAPSGPPAPEPAPEPAPAPQPAPTPAPATGPALTPAPAPAPVDTFGGIESFNFEATLETLADLRGSRTGEGFIGSIQDPDQQLLVRDDVGVDFGDPDNIAPYAVHIFQQRNSDGGVFFNCSGSVINPRTVLFAAHCVNGSDGPIATTSSETYGLPGAGAETTLLIATGQSSADRLFTYLFEGGVGYADGGVAQSTDVIIHPTGNPDNTGLGFPWADVALIALDAPITDVPSLSILLSPLAETTHVLQVGYGTNGTGLTGGTNAGSRFLRRIGENTLGLLGSTADFIDGVFPTFAPASQTIGFESQNYYWTDFDNPDRTPEEVAGCDFTGTNINCGSLADVLAIDFFDGDALPLEAGTGPGDSGSPLVADQLADFPLAIGVLSGGFDFFRLGGTFSDVSFYNPLFPFFEFITENTPYKYVSAVAGDGNWSDPTHWTQDLDPGFFIQDETGAIVNGIPTGNEPGIFASDGQFGSILGQDISDFDNTITAGFEDIDVTLPESSALLGPGSTGFVPQNTDGEIGVAFANPAQYFEVHLNNDGRTTIDIDVEIDKLVVNSSGAELFLPDAQSLTVIQDIEQFAGLVEVDGTLNTPFYTIASGELAGDGGTINTNALFNVAGLVSAGGTTGIGDLSIDGDYVQTSGGALWATFSLGRRRSVSSDFYDISGIAVLDGDLILSTSSRRVRFGSEFTILSADLIDGDFSDVTLVSGSPILDVEHRIEEGDVIVEITAQSIGDLVRGRGGLDSLGDALDTIRQERFAEFVGLFDVVDNATFQTLGATLSSLTPVSAFNQTFTANGFSQRFTGQISQRNLALRGGSRAAGGFSAAGNASYALTGTTPEQTGGLGVFGSASGVFLNGGQNNSVLGNGTSGFGAHGINGTTQGVIGANALERAQLSEAGELTIGADLEVAEGVSFGVAVSNIRNSQLTGSVIQPQEDRSQSVAIYANYSEGAFFADGYAGTSDQQFGVERASQGDFRSAYANAVGQTDGGQTFGGVRLGYAFDLAQGFEAGPVVSMDYVQNRIAGYDEIGAGAFGLSIDDRTFTSMGAKVGAMASLDIATGETSRLRAFGSVAYARELADTADVVTARFAGAADTPFSISNQLDPQWVSVNAGAEFDMGQNVRASISVTSDMGRGLLSNDQAQATVSWRF